MALVWLCGLLWLVACSQPNTGQEKPTEGVVSEGVSSDAGGTPETRPWPDFGLDDTLRLHHIQVKGTHNSYHIASPTGFTEWNYTHAPLDVQLGKQGVRQFELDLYWDKEEKRMRVYHVPALDEKSTCPYFSDCLKTVQNWSAAQPWHLPIFIMIEAKDSSDALTFAEFFGQIEKEIAAAIPKEQRFVPDDLQGSYPSLLKAIQTEGWPTLGKVRGKIAFFFLVSGDKRKTYANGDTGLKDRLMFVTGEVGSPYGVLLSINDPIANEEKIKQAVKDGLLVRTRADSGTEEAMKNDTKRLEAALRSGAHMLSTDFPAKVDGVDYFVDIPGGTPARCNPVSAPPTCTPRSLETP